MSATIRHGTMRIVAFRDTFDCCPRCGTALEDAGSARACRSCGGAFVEEPVLAEMILKMLPPPPRVFGRLELSELQRTGQPLACPSCAGAMTPTAIHDVELDHCKKHGVWFDPDELQLMLYRVADPSKFAPFRPWSPAADLPAAPATSPAPARHLPPLPQKGPAMQLAMTRPDGSVAIVTVTGGVIKVGRVQSAQLRLEGDDISRLHAVIEINPDDVTLIDLGSVSGTFVNGQRITKRALVLGDTIKIGATELRLVGVTR